MIRRLEDLFKKGVEDGILEEYQFLDTDNNEMFRQSLLVLLETYGHEVYTDLLRYIEVMVEDRKIGELRKNLQKSYKKERHFFKVFVRYIRGFLEFLFRLVKKILSLPFV